MSVPRSAHLSNPACSVLAHARHWAAKCGPHKGRLVPGTFVPVCLLSACRVSKSLVCCLGGVGAGRGEGMGGGLGGGRRIERIGVTDPPFSFTVTSSRGIMTGGGVELSDLESRHSNPKTLGSIPSCRAR